MFGKRKLSSWGQRVALPAVMSLGLWSCAEPVLDVNVKIIKDVCDGANNDPMKDVALFRLTVYGDGIDSTAMQTNFAVGDARGDLKGIKIGQGRNLVIEAFDSTDHLVARGETGPLNLDQKDAKDAVSATVFLRGVDQFTPANLSDNPKTCSKLIQARAGHTATKLTDGRVLIAGGYTQNGDKRTYLKTSEIYDPKTGRSSPGPDLGAARAFHTATQLPGTKYTLIAGGEGDKGAVGAAILYDEATNNVEAISMVQKRTRHVAVLANAGSDGSQPPVMLLGGYGGTDATKGLNPIKAAEVFDPTEKKFKDVSAVVNLPKGFAEASAAPLPDGRVIVLGGWDGQNPVKDVLFLSYTPAKKSYTQSPATLTLNDAHLWPVVTATSNSLVIVTGGFQTHDQMSGDLSTAQTTTEYVSIKNGNMTTFNKGLLATLPTQAIYRAGAALPTGKLLLVGGLESTGDMAAASAQGSIIELVEGNLKRRDTKGAGSVARYLAQTTLLDDGSVLVTGGLSSSGGMTTPIEQIDVFTPNYTGVGGDPHK